MLDLLVPKPSGRPLRVLCLGAHCDDIEIGCGATLLELAGSREVEMTWAIFTSNEVRRTETEAARDALLGGAAACELLFHEHRDGFLPFHAAAVKDDFEALKGRVDPDLVLTHYRQDRHQDHRLVSDLTYNTFRRHLVLEYEIPKVDGDLGNPQVYSVVSRESGQRKIDAIIGAYASQSAHSWFESDLFAAMLRVRGMEAEASSGWAEAFYCRRLRLGL